MRNEWSEAIGLAIIRKRIREITLNWTRASDFHPRQVTSGYTLLAPIFDTLLCWHDLHSALCHSVIGFLSVQSQLPEKFRILNGWRPTLGCQFRSILLQLNGSVGARLREGGWSCKSGEMNAVDLIQKVVYWVDKRMIWFHEPRLAINSKVFHSLQCPYSTEWSLTGIPQILISSPGLGFHHGHISSAA